MHSKSKLSCGVLMWKIDLASSAHLGRSAAGGETRTYVTCSGVSRELGVYTRWLACSDPILFDPLRYGCRRFLIASRLNDIFFLHEHVPAYFVSNECSHLTSSSSRTHAVERVLRERAAMPPKLVPDPESNRSKRKVPDTICKDVRNIGFV